MSSPAAGSDGDGTAPEADGVSPDGEDGVPDADEAIRMTLTFADASAGQEILQCLADTDGEVEFTVDCVSRDGSRSCTIDVGTVSQNRLETARLAVEHGYYESPRRSSLSELAEVQGVSESAISQKLAAVERTLVTALVESCEPACDG